MFSFTQIGVLATVFLQLGYAAPTVQPAAGDAIPGKYIVVLRPGVDAASTRSHIDRISLAAPYGIERTYGGQYSFNGYAGTFSKAILDVISADPKVRQPQPYAPATHPPHRIPFWDKHVLTVMRRSPTSSRTASGRWARSNRNKP